MSRVVSRYAGAGRAAAIVAVVSWGLGPVIVKDIELPGLALAFHRLWLGALLWLVVLHARGGRLSLRALRAAAPGGLAFGLDILLFFTAVKRTSVANASVIGALQPALVLIVVGPLFGERVRSKDVAWTVVALVGVAVVVLGSADTGRGSLAGDVLAVGALLAWTWYFVASKRARATLGAVEYQAAMSLVAVGLAAPVVLLSGEDLAVHHPTTWWWIALMVAGPGGGHFLMNWAHAHAPLSLTSLLTLATPVVAAAGAALVLDEPITGWQALGMVVVIASLASVVRRPPAAEAEWVE